MNRKAVKITFRVLGYVLIVALLATIWFYASKTTAVPEETVENNLVFTPVEGTPGQQVVAENARFQLRADLKSHWIGLTDKKTGAHYTSEPEGMEAAEGMKNMAKMNLSSLMQIQYADRDSNISTQNSKAGSVNKHTASAEKIKNGVRFTYHFEQEQFVVPLEVVLTEKGIEVSVPMDKIQEGSSALKLTGIAVLPGFGAHAEGTAGYMLVPDGSGALIPYVRSDGKYAQRVYGRDPAVSAKTDDGFTEEMARLPVFGSTDGSHACVGIITEGDARAWIKADPPTEKSPFGTVYTQFVYREKILVDVSQQTFESTQANLFEPGHCRLDRFAVEYRFPDGSDYVAMANTYRQYLQDDKGMQPLTASVGALQVQLVGGILHTENFLGMPVSNVLPVTTYADAVELVDQLHQQGVDRVCANYLHWYKDGTKRRLTLGVNTESRLGSKQDFIAMHTALSANGGQVFFDLNFTELYGSHNGFSSRYDSARTVLLEPLSVFRYLPSTHQQDELSSPLYLLNADRMQNAADQFMAAKQTGDFRYSLNAMGSGLYSDFGKEGADRGLMLQVFTSTMESMQKHAGKMLFYSPNAYALPYAQAAQGVPTGSSAFLCETEDVPFYAFALHGLVPMSCEAINVKADRTTVLKAAESGIGLTYILGAQNTNMFKDTASADYRYLDAKYWIPEAAKNYNASKEYIRAVENQAVKSHAAVADGVYKTVFANGVGVLVNYNRQPVTVAGQTVPAEDFTVIHE